MQSTITAHTCHHHHQQQTSILDTLNDHHVTVSQGRQHIHLLLRLCKQTSSDASMKRSRRLVSPKAIILAVWVPLDLEKTGSRMNFVAPGCGILTTVASCTEIPFPCELVLRCANDSALFRFVLSRRCS